MIERFSGMGSEKLWQRISLANMLISKFSSCRLAKGLVRLVMIEDKDGTTLPETNIAPENDGKGRRFFSFWDGATWRP